jgi:endonuclease-3
MNKAVNIILQLQKLYPPSTSRPAPFHSLISAMLSHRTRDEKTEIAAKRLLKAYPTPRSLAQADVRRVEELIRDVGFYRVKARRVVEAARIIEERGFPETLEELMQIPGVGRKTANCVLSYGLNQPAVAVDTHVHRICNRMGIVNTKTPQQTEAALQNLLPQHLWSTVNKIFIPFGKQICKPQTPRCAECTLSTHCKKEF